MITKDILRQQLLEYCGDLLSIQSQSSPQLNEGVKKYLEYLKVNYENLSDDAKVIADKTFNNIQDFAAETIISMPDSKEKRILKRLHSSSKGIHFQITELIKILDSPPLLKEEYSKEFRKIFIERVQNIVDLLHDVIQKTLNGNAPMAQLSLLYATVDELVAAFHLSQHYYVTQAYSHLRTILEHLDKVELFRLQPIWADTWYSKDDKIVWKELKPSQVRIKLGKPSKDWIYDFFSSLGVHSNFKAIQSRMATMVEKSAEGNPVVSIWIGGCPFEHNIVIFTTFGIYVINKVLRQVMISFENNLNHKECLELFRQSYWQEKEYIKNYFITWAKKEKLDVSTFEKHLEEEDLDIFKL